MASKLPADRQTGCIWITKEDGWALREAILPFEPPKQDLDVINRTEMLSLSIYEALLRMELEGREGINLEVELVDCLIINSRVKSGQWAGADIVLLQTFQHLHEQRYATVRLAPATDIELVLEEGPPDAIHQTRDAEGTDISPRPLAAPRRRRAAKLRSDQPRTGLHSDQGGELSDIRGD